MFELFHIFHLFYLLFSKQYAYGTWKSQDLCHLSKKKPIGWKFHTPCTCFCERPVTFVNWMSKKTFCPCLHTERVLISGLASSPVKPFNSSLSIFCSFRSTSTSFKVVFYKFTSKSWTLLSLIIIKPPLLQFIAWVTS